MTNQVECFHAAVTVLAGHGHIKQRLIKAYDENLSSINVEDLPQSLRQAFADLRQQMYSVTPLKGEGAISASVRKMSFNEASDCAAQVVNLFGELARTKDAAQVVLPLDDDEDGRVPPFLVKMV